jgi:hypothetical protein
MDLSMGLTDLETLSEAVCSRNYLREALQVLPADVVNNIIIML